MAKVYRRLLKKYRKQSALIACECIFVIYLTWKWVNFVIDIYFISNAKIRVIFVGKQTHFSIFQQI